MLSTPAGSPASAKTSASRKPNSGVSSGGLRTTVQPASSAGASFGNDSPSGKFHGTMAPTTPTGGRRTSSGPWTPSRSSSHGKVDARGRVASRLWS